MNSFSLTSEFFSELIDRCEGENLDFHYLEECPSSNLVCFEKLKSTESKVGQVVFTLHQTEGRGRYGRTWNDKKGNCLMMSIGFPTFLKSISWVPLVAGLCAKESFRLNQEESFLKWPNDLYFGDKKIAGILCESKISGDDGSFVVGLGINLDSSNFSETCGIFELRELSREDLQSQILHFLNLFTRSIYHLEQKFDSKYFIDWWGNASGFVGKRVQVRLSTQSEFENATVLGLSDDAFLRVQMENGESEIVKDSSDSGIRLLF